MAVLALCIPATSPRVDAVEVCSVVRGWHCTRRRAHDGRLDLRVRAGRTYYVRAFADGEPIGYEGWHHPDCDGGEMFEHGVLVIDGVLAPEPR